MNKTLVGGSFLGWVTLAVASHALSCASPQNEPVDPSSAPPTTTTAPTIAVATAGTTSPAVDPAPVAEVVPPAPTTAERIELGDIETRAHYGYYATEGFAVQKYECPACPPPLHCKTCPGESVTLADRHSAPQHQHGFHIRSDQLALFQIGQRYRIIFVVNERDPDYEGLNTVRFVRILAPGEAIDSPSVVPPEIPQHPTTTVGELARAPKPGEHVVDAYATFSVPCDHCPADQPCSHCTGGLVPIRDTLRGSSSTVTLWYGPNDQPPAPGVQVLNRFRFLVQQHPDGWVELKKILAEL